MNKILDSALFESICVGVLVGVAAFIFVASILVFAYTIDNASEPDVYVFEDYRCEMIENE